MDLKTDSQPKLSNLSSFPSSLLRSKTFSTGRTIFLPFVLSFSISSLSSPPFSSLPFLLLFHSAIRVIDAAFTNHLRRKIQASQHVFSSMFSLLPFFLYPVQSCNLSIDSSNISPCMKHTECGFLSPFMILIFIHRIGKNGLQEGEVRKHCQKSATTITVNIISCSSKGEYWFKTIAFFPLFYFSFFPLLQAHENGPKIPRVDKRQKVVDQTKQHTRESRRLKN